ncbi:MAG: hypothetical protein K9N62_06690 [Verrucomicrobia bacterium]|nr:hypothetical protein [Verrucomicrobiota bacterium]
MNSATDERTRATGEWMLYGVGLLATVVVTIFVTRIAKKALAKKIEAKPYRC